MLSLEQIEKIRKNPRRVDWKEISRTPGLSEEFIREFADWVDWEYISCYQDLSKELIREFADQVFWFFIVRKQQISQDFIIEMMGKIHFHIFEWGLIQRCQDLGYDVQEIQKYYRLCQIC